MYPSSSFNTPTLPSPPLTSCSPFHLHLSSLLYLPCVTFFRSLSSSITYSFTLCSLFCLSSHLFYSGLISFSPPPQSSLPFFPLCPLCPSIHLSVSFSVIPPASICLVVLLRDASNWSAMKERVDGGAAWLLRKKR